MRGFVHGFVLGGLLVAPAFAQTPATSWHDLPDRFQVDTGYFRIKAENVLRFEGRDVDFERDLGIDPYVNTFWLDATWRVGRRHQLKLGFTRLSRDRSNHTLQRDIEWGGETFEAGATATSSTGSDILGGYYRFAVYRNDRFEIGPTIGLGQLWLQATIRATGQVTGPGGGQVTRTLDESASTSSITGAVGGYASAWPLKRLALRADFLYIKVNPGDSEASITDWRLGGDYYFFRNAGVGVQYKFNKYTYDRGILASRLGGEVTFKGVQVFVSFLF